MPQPAPIDGEITRLIAMVSQGDAPASERLLGAVYDDLRRLAAARVAREPAGQTLQATDLVHEAFVRLSAGGQVSLSDKAHFFAAAAEAMRRILIDRARHRQALRHGGGRAREPLATDLIDFGDSEMDLEPLNRALDRLDREDATKAAVVKLRYFVGLTIPQVAEALGISRATVERYWTYSRCRLYQWMSAGEPS